MGPPRLPCLRSPSATPSLEGSVGYSNYDTKAGNVYMTTGLADDVAINLAVTAQDQGKGFNRNLVDGKRYGTNDYVSARSKLLLNFGDSNSLLICGKYTNSENNLANINSPAPGTLPLEHGLAWPTDKPATSSRPTSIPSSTSSSTASMRR